MTYHTKCVIISLDPKVYLLAREALGLFFMIKKLVLLIAIVILLFFVKPVNADLIAGSSADIELGVFDSALVKSNREYFIKKRTIKAILDKYNAPLSGYEDSFIEACVTYDLDCYLLPSISGIESTFGRAIATGTNNPFGWGRGLMPFPSFHEAILTVGKGLRENYIDKGATSIEQIGSIYCEGNTWAGKVNYFMRQFETEEKNQLFLSMDTVQL